MKDGPLAERYRISRKGLTTELPGARYFVLDYVHDPLAAGPARSYATAMRAIHQVVYADALEGSLAGEDEQAVLRAHEVERQDGKVREGSRYVVLDYAHSYPARVALRMYVRKAKENGYPQLAEDLDRELQETLPQYKAHMESKNPPSRKSKKRK